MKKICEINCLRKIYHTKKEEILAVDNFSFSLNEGEFVSIVGPSGCGKSTILSILCGLEEKSSGTINLYNNKKFGYMLQDDCLFPFRTVLKNCILGLELKNKLSKTDIENTENLLKKYGLYEFKDNYPKELSGGMKQRIALIRTLVLKPDILLLDEPFSALDYQTRLAVSNDVYNIIKQEKKTAIMVTHDIAEAISMSNKVIVLSKRPGQIKNVYEINFKDRTDPINNRKNKDFSYFFDLIWKDIESNV